ncbi:MAG: dipeptidase [Magnetococcales bacterium]|nr:dipeptidase [Magnetococcales bacterium]
MKAILESLSAGRDGSVARLSEFLRFPTISCDPGQAGAMGECAAWLADLLARSGLNDARVHATSGHPIVTASWRGAPGRPTLLLYGHYDVQPVDPLDLWDSPPFEPRIHNDRIFARGAMDDKGQVLMHLHAVAATLATHGRLPVNVVFLIEGEEEISSPCLPDFLRAHAELLRADLAVVSDSYMWDEGIPAITTSLRGLVALEVTVTGPNRDLHSGTYGGAVANPVEMLARMLATLKDDRGRIRVAGFLDEVFRPSDRDRDALLAIPFDRQEYCQRIGIATDWGEADYGLLERLWLRPTIEINGMWGGYSGPGVKTVLPAQAHAKLSMRLAPDQTPDLAVERVTRHLHAVTPPGVTVEVRRLAGGGLPWRLPPGLPALDAAKRALRESFGKEPLLVGEGASIPIVGDFQALLGIPSLLVGFGLPDSAPHSPNENFHLPSFHVGTDSLVRMFHYLAD